MDTRVVKPRYPRVIKLPDGYLATQTSPEVGSITRLAPTLVAQVAAVKQLSQGNRRSRLKAGALARQLQRQLPPGVSVVDVAAFL